jgi:hypothetical protein
MESKVRASRVAQEDELCINYMPQPPATREQAIASLTDQLHAAEAHVAAGRLMVGGASQEYAVVSLRRQLAKIQG